MANIKAIASYLPDGRLSNDDLAREFPEWTAQKIEEKTGMRTRAIASPEECASDLGIKAAQKLFASKKYAPADIDFILFCTQSPDYCLPTTACKIQKELGLPTHCGALDFNLGCSGYVYGLSLAKGLIESGSAKNVLLITAETYSKYIRPDDRSVRTIFSDGAAATLIGASEISGIGDFVFGTDGTGIPNLIVPPGGTLHMNGGEIFNFTIETIPKSLTAVLEKNKLTQESVDYFVFHQANHYMLEHLRKKCGIPSDKFCLNMKYFGNTVSATIPMALERALIDKSIECFDTVVLMGFGVGYSWAATSITIGEELMNGSH